MNEEKYMFYVQKILKYLLIHDMVTIQKLCDEIELSDKTVRTRLDYINDYLLINNLGKIVKKPRVGVYLDASDEQKRRLDRLLEKSKSLDMISSSTSRLSSALRYILLIDRRKVLTTQQLAHSLYLSVPTTIKVVKECKDWLALFNIQLDVVRNKGIHLEYSEVSYRLAIKHFIMRFNPEENPEQALLHFAPGLNLNYLRKQIIETEKEWNFELADESFTEVLIYLTLAVYREQKQVVKPIDIAKEEKSRLMEYNEFAFADAIFKKVQKKFSCNFLEDEIAFLSVQILCSKLIDTNFAVSSGELLKRYDDRMREFVNKIIEVVSNVLNVDMRDDEQLFNGLLMHIRPAIFRLRFERKHPNGLIDIIKSEYKQTFRVSWLISVLFEEYYNLKVTEDEISYIAVYVQSALERNGNPIETVLVTHYGMSMNQLLTEKIRQFCPNINDVHIVGYHDFNIYDFPDVKAILSTIELDCKDDRIIMIGPFLNEEDIAKLNRHIKQIMDKVGKDTLRFDSKCHSFFEPDLLFMDLQFDSKPKLLKFLSDQLVKKGYVTKNYYNSVMSRESMTSTSIGNLVAIPHGEQNEINEARVVVAILDKPIFWDGIDEVDVVFLLAVKMTNEYEVEKTQLFYKQYIKLVDTDERVDFLRSFNTNIDLYKYLVK